MEIEPNFAEIISQKTGLTSKKDIAAYTHFVLNTCQEAGTIMYGGVENEFYQELYGEASMTMKVLESAFHNSVGNHEDIPYGLEGRFHSPLSKKAKQEFAKYYHKFMDFGLVSPPKFTSKSDMYYPHLEGYNYYNDVDVYVGYKKEGEEEFAGRMHIDTFKEQTEEQKTGYVFDRQL
ncbi:hypothetical protein HN747_03070 [archaeon]|jgi:hypothetical protein|nr:hypothetical protein [archaeon]